MCGTNFFMQVPTWPSDPIKALEFPG